MSWIGRDKAKQVLSDMIAIPSVNPMGRPCTSSEPVERKVLEYIETLFEPYGVEMRRQRCSLLHESLLITLLGKNESKFTLLESHVDTVPADEWLDTAFTPRVEGSLLYGRGACDDKGPLASMMLALLDILESGGLPPYPVAFLAAGDEEYAQTGIKYFAGLDYPIGRAVIGEATGLVPIIQHKGTVRWDIKIQGRSAHTSRAELGRNAITDAFKVIALLDEHQQYLREHFMNPLTNAPSITVTTIQGGRTRNSVPDECTISVDFRVVPGMNPAEARQALIAQLEGQGIDVAHSEIQLMTPPLDTRREDPFSQIVLRICREATGNANMDFAGAPYGTDAAWVSDKSPSLVLGPGSIESAHAVNENVDLDEVVLCAAIYRDIIMSKF